MQLLSTSPDVSCGTEYPYEERPLSEMALHPRLLKLRWWWFGRRGTTFHAEKAGQQYVSLADLNGRVAYRVLYLVRDPRDVWASIAAFNERRGYNAFGWRDGESRSDFLVRFAAQIKKRSDVMEAERRGCEHMILRYEDLMSDMHGSAGQLGDWLGTRLDASRIALFGNHVTSRSPEQSVGRWRTDVPEPEATYLTRELAGVIERMRRY